MNLCINPYINSYFAKIRIKINFSNYLLEKFYVVWITSSDARHCVAIKYF